MTELRMESRKWSTETLERGVALVEKQLLKCKDDPDKMEQIENQLKELQKQMHDMATAAKHELTYEKDTQPDLATTSMEEATIPGEIISHATYTSSDNMHTDDETTKDTMTQATTDPYTCTSEEASNIEASTINPETMAPEDADEDESPSKKRRTLTQQEMIAALAAVSADSEEEQEQAEKHNATATATHSKFIQHVVDSQKCPETYPETQMEIAPESTDADMSVSPEHKEADAESEGTSENLGNNSEDRLQNRMFLGSIGVEQK